MRNIFLLYMPPGNAEAMVHYQDTIRNKVGFSRIATHLSSTSARKLQQVFGPHPIAVWGSKDSKANRAKFDRMRDGDEILIVEGKLIKLLGRVAHKEINPKLSRELWKNLRGESTEGWDLIYFIANPREIDLSYGLFCDLVGYKPKYQLRGLTRVEDKKLARFYSKYDDLYSILVLLKQGGKVQEVAEPQAMKTVPVREEEILPPRELSDHPRMINNGSQRNITLASFQSRSLPAWIHRPSTWKTLMSCGSRNSELALRLKLKIVLQSIRAYFALPT